MTSSVDNPESAEAKPASSRRDIVKVCELSDKISELNLQHIIDGYKEQDAEYTEVLRQMRELQAFTLDFKLLFMPLPPSSTKQDSAPPIHNMTIAIGPQNLERISSIIRRCENLGRDQQQPLAQRLQRSVSALEKVEA